MSASNQMDARVTKVLVEALGVEEHDIKPCEALQRDLGAESIDYLDIIFRLEREFMIKIPRGELLAEPLFTGDREIVKDGRVTDEGLALLRTAHALRRLDWIGAPTGDWAASMTFSPSVYWPAISDGSSVAAAQPTRIPTPR